MIIEEMFVSFRYHMYEDKEVLDAWFQFLEESLWL